MNEGRPSQTALGAAVLRAAHQLVDLPPVFVDPLALRIVGPVVEEELRVRGGPEMKGLRAFVAARSRFAEDCFAAGSFGQYVVLGAGLDTFTYRNSGVRAFEIDHPATQGWKREMLAAAGIAEPPLLTFAPLDFEKETLRQGLARTSFDFTKPAFFAWLGVTPYLSLEAITATLSEIAKCAKGSELVFDFATQPGGSAKERAAREALAQRVAAAGEPFRNTLEPDALIKLLRDLGYARVEIEDSASLNARYFAGREDGLQLRGGHLAHAFL
jgi:methyltransferase (TIGR00027 family)